MKREVILETIVFLLILLFVYAAVAKLLDYRIFVSQISGSPLIGLTVSKILAWLIPALEIICVVMLLISQLRRKGLYLAFGLMAVFTFYVAFSLIFTAYRACSCGGILSGMSFEQHLVFNIVFLTLATLGIRIQRQVDNSNTTFSTN